MFKPLVHVSEEYASPHEAGAKTDVIAPGELYSETNDSSVAILTRETVEAAEVKAVAANGGTTRGGDTMVA